MPFVAKRAVILAAGRGERLRPLTDKIPKPLLLFDNRPIIETIIERIRQAQIEEIVVVTGYMAEKFEYLPRAFKNVKIHFNPHWHEGNNVLSVASVIDLVEDALVINGDAIITDNVLHKEYEGTTMYADRSPGFSREWELLLSANGTVTSINTLGGYRILQQREITFVCSADFPAFKEKVLMSVRPPAANAFFEYCLLPQAEIHVLELPYNTVFDLDGYDEWMNHPLTDKKDR